MRRDIRESRAGVRFRAIVSLSKARLKRDRGRCVRRREARVSKQTRKDGERRRRVENTTPRDGSIRFVFASSTPPVTPEPFQKVREPQNDGLGVSLRERAYRQHDGILHRPERPDSGPHPGGSQFPLDPRRDGERSKASLVDPHSSNAADSATPRQEYRAMAHCLRRSIRRPTSPPTNPPALSPRSPRPDPPAPSFAATSAASFRVMFRINALSASPPSSRGAEIGRIRSPGPCSWGSSSRIRPSTRAAAASFDLALVGMPFSFRSLFVPMGDTWLVCLAMSCGRTQRRDSGTPISDDTARTRVGSRIATACHSRHMRRRSGSVSSVYSP